MMGNCSVVQLTELDCSKTRQVLFNSVCYCTILKVSIQRTLSNFLLKGTLKQKSHLH